METYLKMITVNTRQEFLEAVDDLLPTRPVCCEIGVYRGDFSKMIMDQLYPEKLVLIDPFEKGGESYGEEMKHLTTAYSSQDDFEYVKERFKTYIESGMVYINRNYSYKVSYPDDHFDFLYHDSSHMYFDIKKDLVEWRSAVKPSGLICGHDFCDIKSFGVKQAVNEFMEECGFEMFIYNENGGDFALKRKK